MNKFLVVNIAICLFVLSCNGNKSNREINKVNDNKQLVNALLRENTDTNSLQKVEELKLVIDTLSLKNFWEDFKSDIIKNNRDSIIKTLDFPIHATYILLFNFAYDCDTITFTENENKYSNIDINQSNIDRYYDFVFSDILKSFIEKTTIQDLLQKGIIYDDGTGLSYRFFPREYVKTKCSSDYVLKFNIYKTSDKWKINIGGL